MKEIYDKIAKALTIDELDTFIKEIWLHDRNKIEVVVKELTERLRDRVSSGEYSEDESLTAKFTLIVGIIKRMMDSDLECTEIADGGLRIIEVKSRKPEAKDV